MKAKKKKTPSPQSNWFLAFIGTPNFDPLAEGTGADCRRQKIELYFISRFEKENVVFIVIRSTSDEDFLSSNEDILSLQCVAASTFIYCIDRPHHHPSPNPPPTPSIYGNHF